MTRQWTLPFAAFVLCAAQIAAQTPVEDFTFRISGAKSWTGTGLELQSGDVLQVSTSVGESSNGTGTAGSPLCNPQGLGARSAQAAELPLPSAPAGALIARLHAQGAAPILVGAGTELCIEESSHLFLAMNVTDAPPCQASLVVKIHKVSAGSTTTSEGVAASSQQETRGQHLKSQLANAAQIFMTGQFGIGKSESKAVGSNADSSENTSGSGSSSAPTSFTVSDAALDPDLRKNLNELPRRVNDQFNNLGDMVNFVIVGSQKDVQAALDAASWHVADTGTGNAVLAALKETYEEKDYLQMPMSTLYLFGRKQDFGYEMAEPIAMVASRHHFRIWKAPFSWQGHEVWVGAGTHDIGFAKDRRNGNVTHKIDPAVDGERDNIGSSLQKANKAKTISYYLPSNPIQQAKNATGDGYQSDGRLLVIFLQ